MAVSRLKDLASVDVSDLDFVVDQVATFASHQAVADTMYKSIHKLDTRDFESISKFMREQTIGRIMTVRANAVMLPSSEGKKHSLFLPRHVETRTDKGESDSLSRVLDQFESAVAA